MNRRRMDREQLNEARRIIGGLVRNGRQMGRRANKAASELPEDYRQCMQLALDKTALVRLEKILERMKGDPLLGSMKLELGREKAIHYAIAFCAEHMPERITAAG